MSFEEHLGDFAKKESASLISKRIEAAIKGEKAEQALLKIVNDIDKNQAMITFRAFWDKLPKLLQWGLLNAHRSIQPLGGDTANPLRFMIKLGFITYKGHLNEDGSTNQKKIEKMGGLEKYAIKYGIKLGAYFIPELKIISPFIEPLMKVDQAKGDLFTKVRTARENLRKEVLAEQKEKQKPELVAMPGLKASPANDNAIEKIKKAA